VREYTKSTDKSNAEFAHKPKPSCKGCRFFHASPQYRWETRGECRRRCPIIGHGDYGQGGAFPSIDDGQWCGEWEPARDTHGHDFG
jgi:hypothetical protein